MNMKMVRQLQDLQKQMARAQQQLGEEEVEGSAGGGAVKVRMTGHGRVTAVTIAPEACDPDDVEMLQDLVLTALNDASDRVQALQQERLGGLTGGKKIPGLF